MRFGRGAGSENKPAEQKMRENDFRVAVSVGGRFHAFDLARELHRRGCLEKLLTSYPRGRAVRAGVPREKVVSLPAKELIFQLWRRLPETLRQRVRPHYFVSELFDRQAQRRLNPCDILIGWSGFSLKTLRRAKEFGAKTILERGSSHILTQTSLLREEYLAQGLEPVLAHPGIVAKELQEYREADYISVPSSFARQSFLDQGIPANKLLVVPYGADLGQFRPGPGGGKTFRAVFAGRICLRKGVHYLLKAFTELNLPAAELVLAGEVDGEMKPFLSRYRSGVRWLGKLSREELAQVFRESSVLVMPSIEEGLALVQVQALAAGLPLICTPNSGGADLIEPGVQGYIVPVRDEASLQNRLLELYRDRDKLRRMGRWAAERAKESWTWEAYGNKVLQNCRKILGRAG